MPWTVNDPPPPAKNWDYSKRLKCVKAANAVLNSGKSDQEAVYACIAAAGMSTKQGDDEDYDRIAEEDSEFFKSLVTAYFAGRLTKSAFESTFKESISTHFVRLMDSALGRDPTQKELDMLNRFLTRETQYFDGFMRDIEGMTEGRAAWRAGLYGYSRHVYTAYTIPIDVVELMPYLPGEDCLGGDLCHCSLDVQYNSDGDALVYWQLDPGSESCEVCITHALESPFVFVAAELRGE